MAEAEIIGRRRSFDGVSVLLWSDGGVTSWAEALPGVPVRRPRTTEARERALRAAWLFAGEVELYERGELGALYRAAEAVARRGGLPGDVRAEVARLMEPRVRLHFSSTMGDSRGDWVEQWAVLDRFRWPGLAVLRTRARYELLQQVSGSGGYESYTTTGFRFANRRELVQHLLRVQGTAQHSWRAA